MPTLRDIPKVHRSIGLFELARRIKREIDDDNLFALGAALAYSWLFAIFPFMIFLLGLLPYLPEQTKVQAKAEIREAVYALPKDAADTIWRNVEEILGRTRGGLLSVGLIVTIWGASGGMNTTISSINRCYEIDQSRPFYKQRPLAVLLTVAMAVMLVSVLVLMPVGTIALRWLAAHGHAYVSTPLLWTIRVMRYPVATLLMFGILNIIYHFGPEIRQKWVFFTPGAVFCIVVWFLLGLAFRYYIDHFGKFNETYGAVGGVIIILFMFYLDAVVLLVGAEINSEIDYQVLGVERGSRDFTRPDHLAHRPT